MLIVTVLALGKINLALRTDFTALEEPLARVLGGGIEFTAGFNRPDTYTYSGDKADFDFLSENANNSLFIVAKFDETGNKVLLTTKTFIVVRADGVYLNFNFNDRGNNNISYVGKGQRTSIDVGMEL